MKAGLNEYENIIVHEMESLGVLNYKATEIVNKYLPVIRELNDTHDSARIQAERYIEAYKKEIDPDVWLNKINKIRGTLPATNNKPKKSPARLVKQNNTPITIHLEDLENIASSSRASSYNDVLELITNQQSGDDYITARVKTEIKSGLHQVIVSNEKVKKQLKRSL